MDAQAGVNLARIVASQGKIGEAISILKGVLQSEPRNVEAWLALADVIDDPARVKQCLERVLSFDPGNAIARQKLDQLNQPWFPDFIESNSLSSWDQPEHADRYLEEKPSEEVLFQQESQPSSSSKAPLIKPIHLTSVEPQEKKKTKPKGRGLEIALIGLVIVVVCILAAVLVLPQSGSLMAVKPTPTPEDPRLVIYANIKAANDEDIEAYMATIYPRTLTAFATESSLEDINREYDLYYRVSNLKVLEQNETDARVSFVLTTKKIRGPGFQNNRITGVFNLKKHEEHWKIYDQEIQNIDYID